MTDHVDCSKRDSAPYSLSNRYCTTITPHVAQNHSGTRSSAIDGRTTRHPGYGVSQRIRKRIEEPFGWIKAQAGLGKVKLRGLAKAKAVFTFAVVAYNLVRIPKLLGQPA